MYASRLGYSSSCPPVPTLNTPEDTLSLRLTSPPADDTACTADSVPVVVTVTGLDAPPERLTITETDNASLTVAVHTTTVASTTDLPCRAVQRTAVDLNIPGPGQPTPTEAVALLLLDQLAVGAVEVDGRKSTVAVIGKDNAVLRVYSLTLRQDGWWPDGFITCEQQVP